LGEGGAFALLLKAFLEQAMEGEVEDHIAEGELPNRKNGKGKKTIRTTLGERSPPLATDEVASSLKEYPSDPSLFLKTWRSKL
jgi:hypothetical protein